MTGAAELVPEIAFLSAAADFEPAGNMEVEVGWAGLAAMTGGTDELVPAEDWSRLAEAMRTTLPTPSPWQNQNNPLDVDADGRATPRDALLVINQLNAGTQVLSPESGSRLAFVDVNGDLIVTPRDALELVNALNIPPAAGEATVEGGLTTALPGGENSLSEDAGRQTSLPSTESPLPSNLLAAAVPSALVPADPPDGKTSISYLDEPFANYSAGFNGVRYVKCHILTSDPATVYFQDSVKYLYHYDFATARLEPFLNMTREQFDAVSLHLAGQQVVMATVLMSPDGKELAVQLVGHDAYPREDVAAWIQTIVAAVQSDTPLTVLYMPAYEQAAAAEADRSWFASQGITVADSARWARGNVTYAEGWATGRLVQIPAADIKAAYGDGRLRPTDILLLTDGVPAEVPYVRGIITLTPATPNSHVAILARNQQLPFAWVQDAAEQQRILQLAGQSVLLRASLGRVAVSRLDAPLTPSSVADQLAALQTPARANVIPTAEYGKWLEDATGLTPDQIEYFGGKAANYGLLRRTIPDNSQRAMAFSFDLWNAFMSNLHPTTGRTLREEIDARLGSFSYPPDMTLARQKLAEVNTLIRKTVKWTEAQKTRILDELIAAFPDVPHDQFLRFRSSSNAEDSQELTGAGLYDSFSGCIADDTDADTKGPSHADPNEPDEKGVLRAIEKVFASFYNENAWLERLRHGVREQDTGMAILVHHNFPDELEMANGVVTFKFTRSQWGDYQEVSYAASIVTQLGALSVTNPEGGAIAEEVNAFFGPGQVPYLYVRTPSTLVPIGGTVMTWESDYTELMQLIARVAEGYAEQYPDKSEFTLDLEFKRMTPGELIVKQVREIPTAQSQLTKPLVLNEPTDWVVLQSEFTDVWAHHRLKSELSMSTINGSLDTGSNPLTGLNLKVLSGSGAGATLVDVGGPPTALPGYEFASASGEFRNGFTLGTGSSARKFQLKTMYPNEVDSRLSPAITPLDFTQELQVSYARPVPWLDNISPATRLTDRVTLYPSRLLTASDEVSTRTFTIGNVQITTSFKWWKADESMIVKTLPVAEWVETVITGLTTTPLRLTSEYAQSYGPGHHNFVEEFIFEPALDPAVTAAQKAELAAANVRLLHVFHNRMDLGLPGAANDKLTILGLDDSFRAVGQVTLADVYVKPGGNTVLVPRGTDDRGQSFTFSNPVWQIDGGGTLAAQGNSWFLTGTEPGRWKLTCTDPNRPGYTGTATVFVAGVALDWSGTLQIVGTAGHDTITINPVGNGRLRVNAGFLTGAERTHEFALDQIYQIQVSGAAGRDVIVASGIDLPVWIDGGKGDDLIWGGGGSDVLLGGDGNDILWGQGGRNLLIGGAGYDVLFGGLQEDILIGGRTGYSDPLPGADINRMALRMLLDEWNADRSNTVRRANLRDGSGSSERLNDNYFLQLGSTVFDDGRWDSLIGAPNRHWQVPS